MGSTKSDILKTLSNNYPNFIKKDLNKFVDIVLKEIEIALQDTAAKKQDGANRLEQGKAQINQLMQSQQPPKMG